MVREMMSLKAVEDPSVMRPRSPAQVVVKATE